jgi:HSP20 family protein
MNLVTWDPFRDLNLLQGDMNRLFERFGAEGQRQGSRPWMPALDIAEQDDHFLVHCDLPGMAEDDVSIEVEDRTLRISGERRAEHDTSKDGYRRVERAYGRFERVLTLPEGVDAEAITASFDKGVLTLSVPKPEQVKPRRIQISGASAQRTIEGEASGGSDERNKKPLKDRVLARA